MPDIDGDRRELTPEFQARRTSLRGYILAHVRSAPAAEGILQELWPTVCAEWLTQDPSTPFGPWARSAAHGRLLRDLEAYPDAPRLLDAGLSERLAAEPDWDRADDAEKTALATCVGKLGPKLKELLDLRCRAGLDAPRIAERTGLKTRAVCVALIRARLDLTRCVRMRLAAAGDRTSMKTDAGTLLAVRYFGEDLGESELDGLRRRLVEDAACRRGFVRMARREAVLSEVLSAAARGRASGAGRARRLAEERAAGRVARVRSLGADWRRLGRLGAGTLLILVLLLAHKLRLSPAPPPAAPAAVTAAEGQVIVVRGADQIWVNGRLDLCFGDRLVVFGAQPDAAVAFPDGTRLQLGGNTCLALRRGPGAPRSAVAVEIEQGELEAEAVARADSVAFLTPHAAIHAANARFRLAVSGALTRIDLTRGRARVQAAVGTNAVDVAQGHYAVAGTNLPLAVFDSAAGP